MQWQRRGQQVMLAKPTNMSPAYIRQMHLYDVDVHDNLIQWQAQSQSKLFATDHEPNGLKVVKLSN